MAGKLTDKEWRKVRARWESEEDAGYHWLVRAMKLPVSAPAVRKRALKEGWTKNPVKISERAAAVAMTQATQKPAPETVGIAAGTQIIPADELVSRFDLTEKQALHAREFMVDFNPVASAIRAGYTEETAQSKGSAMVGKPAFQSAIAYMMRERLERMGRDADELVAFHLAVLDFDPNEVCEHRIHACRHCWGVDFASQHTPSSWAREREKFQKAWKKMSETEQKAVGEFPAVPPDGWYEAKRGPNDDCPECHGIGVSVLKWKDSRHFSPKAKLLFSGIKEGKEGLEVVMLQKQASLTTLSSHLGLNKVAEVQVNTAIVTETARDFETIMADARARQHRVLVERGILPADSAAVVDG